MHAPHPTKAVAVKTLAWVLVGIAAYDGAGYLAGGPQVTRSSTYAVLAQVPYGMRFWGVILLAGAVAISWAIGRDGRGDPHALNVTLAIGFGFYSLWAMVIPATWIYLDQIPAWGALSKSLGFAAIYLLCARAVAPRVPTWVDRLLHRLIPTRANRGQE